MQMEGTGLICCVYHRDFLHYSIKFLSADLSAIFVADLSANLCGGPVRQLVWRITQISFSQLVYRLTGQIVKIGCNPLTN
jgi:hypothetical protein